MADRIDLNKYEKGLATLEGILNQGLRIIPDDTMESKSGIKNILPPASGQYDKATANTLIAVLKSNADHTRPIAGDPAGLREALSQAQQRTTAVYAGICEQFDMFERLEKMLRTLHPDTGCIRGDGCGDDLIVSCRVCIK